MGTGPALIQEVLLDYGDGTRQGSATFVVPPNGIGRADFLFAESGPDAELALDIVQLHEAFAVEVRYRDMSGQVAEMTRISLGVGYYSGFGVNGVDLYEDGAKSPYLSSQVMGGV